MIIQLADFGDIVEVLFFVAIIAITLIVRAIKLAGEKAQRQNYERQQRERSEDNWVFPSIEDRGWEEWRPEGQDFQVEWQEPQPTPHAAPTKAEQETVETAQPRYASKPTAAPAPAAFHQSQPQRTDVPECNVPDREAIRAMEKAMAVAFPKVRRMARARPIGAERKIHLHVKSGRDLRRAILLKEVLGQPRAFDL